MRISEQDRVPSYPMKIRGATGELERGRAEAIAGSVPGVIAVHAA